MDSAYCRVGRPLLSVVVFASWQIFPECSTRVSLDLCRAHKWSGSDETVDLLSMLVLPGGKLLACSPSLSNLLETLLSLTVVVTIEFVTCPALKVVATLKCSYGLELWTIILMSCLDYANVMLDAPNSSVCWNLCPPNRCIPTAGRRRKWVKACQC